MVVPDARSLPLHRMLSCPGRYSGRLVAADPCSSTAVEVAHHHDVLHR